MDPTGAPPADGVTLFLCGDVMLGRGIDHILPHPGDPRLHEAYVTSAGGYVALAEARHGPIPRRAAFGYVWGDALADLRRARPQARIVNLETSITTSAAPVLKGINYKMHPRNAPCLTAGEVDCCVLANNHVLDWGAAGLVETLATLERHGIRSAGAGRHEAPAEAPAVIDLAGGGRVLVFGVGTESSGIPRAWAAGAARPGVSLLADLSTASAARLAGRIGAARRPGDVVVVSVHWGSNWGYRIAPELRRFARALIDAGACDIVHGHSSHHPRAIEVHGRRLVLYGCGDFINDYEGVHGYERYRGDLCLGYLARLSATSGALQALVLLPYQMRRFRLQRASPVDRAWLRATLDRESAPFGMRIACDEDGLLAATWR